MDDIKGAVPQANTPSKTAAAPSDDLLGIDLLAVDPSGPGQASQSTTSSNPLDLFEVRPVAPLQKVPKPTPVDLSGGLLDLGLTDAPITAQTNKPVSSPLDNGGFGLMDLMGGPEQIQTPKLPQLSVGLGQTNGTTGLDLLGGLDITPSPKPAGITMSTGPAPSPPPKPVDLLEGLGLGALGVGLTGDSTGNTAKKLDFIGYEDSFMNIRFICSKVDFKSDLQINSSTVRMEMIAKSKNVFALNNFKLAISAAKYLTMELGHASGNLLAANGSNEVRQVAFFLCSGAYYRQLTTRPEACSSANQSQVRLDQRTEC